MKKIKFFKLATLMFLISFFSACKKEASHQQEMVQASAENVAECFFVEQYTQYGDFYEDYLKNRLLSGDPYELIPEVHRAEFIAELANLNQQTEGMDTEASLNFFINEGLLSQERGDAISNMRGIIENALMVENDMQSAIDGLVQQRINYTTGVELSCDDKKYVITVYSLIEKLLQFYADTEQEPASASGILPRIMDCSGCDWWDRIWCSVDEIVYYTYAGPIIGCAFGADYIQGPDFPEEPEDPKEAQDLAVIGCITGAIVGAVVGVVAGTATEIRDEDCCDECDCRAPSFVSLIFADDCSASATYVAGGFGSDIVELIWANDDGTPPTATTPVSAPNLSIVQSVPSVSVRTTITAICEDGSSKISNEFKRDLSAIALEVPEIGIAGVTEPVTNLGITYTYYALGMNDPRLSGTWSIMNGTIVSSNSTSVEVLWNQEGSDAGEVVLNAINTCPGGESDVFELQIDLSNSGPQ